MAKIHHIEIHPGHPKDGKFHGATVEHHHEREYSHSSGRGLTMGETPEEEKHMFGEQDGHEMLAHLANHLHISETGHGEKDSEAEDAEEVTGAHERDV